MSKEIQVIYMLQEFILQVSTFTEHAIHRSRGN